MAEWYKYPVDKDELWKSSRKKKNLFPSGFIASFLFQYNKFSISAKSKIFLLPIQLFLMGKLKMFIKTDAPAGFATDSKYVEGHKEEQVEESVALRGLNKANGRH